MLPALSVQPIVENAVKHGISKKEQGGKVEISTEENKDCFIVRVSDNGVGFDPAVIPEDDSKHIGISNVRERLAIMCNGELLIESVSGEGTVAVIKIPKRGGRR